MAPKFSRAQGASSGVESYFIALILVIIISNIISPGLMSTVRNFSRLFVFQVVIMGSIDRSKS